MANGSDMTVLDAVCTQLDRIQVVFVVALLFLLVSLAAFSVVEPGSASYVLNVVNVVVLGVVTLVSGSLARLCQAR